MSTNSKNKSVRRTRHTDGRQVADKKWFCAAWLTPAVVALILCCLLLAGPAWADTTWPQRQKLLAADGAAEDRFGWSVSISGDYAIVSALFDDDKGSDSGSAYIFRWDGTDWIQKRKLIAADGDVNDWFGFSASISGDYAIIGAPYNDDRGISSGSAYIFKRSGETWLQQAKLLAADGAAGDWFGNSVSISGDYAIVGASCDDDRGSDSGSAYIFKREGVTWLLQAKLTASDGAAYDYFGNSVSISGGYVIIGAVYDNDKGADSGSAYIFKREGAAWLLQAKLLASDGAFNDWFGSSVSISGDYAIVGACFDDDEGTDSGSAYIFKREGAAWLQQAKILAADDAARDYFGYSVSISGDYTIVGAYGDDDGGSYAGSAYIFKREGAAWNQQQKLTAADGAAEDHFGLSVSISGDYAIVGAYYGDGNVANCGSAYAFMKCPIADLSGDCFVDFADFAIMAEQWLHGYK